MAVNKKVEIIEHISDLNTNDKGWIKELNKVSWNGNDPKYDIREWSPDHERMGRGNTFTHEEMIALKAALNQTDLSEEE